MDPNRWRLDGQLALVTGGSAGIGRAIARELLGFGADVLLAARDGDALELARDELAEEFPDARHPGASSPTSPTTSSAASCSTGSRISATACTSWSTTPAATVSKAATDYTEDEWRADLRGQPVLRVRTVALCATRC